MSLTLCTILNAVFFLGPLPSAASTRPQRLGAKAGGKRDIFKIIETAVKKGEVPQTTSIFSRSTTTARVAQAAHTHHIIIFCLVSGTSMFSQAVRNRSSILVHVKRIKPTPFPHMKLQLMLNAIFLVRQVSAVKKRFRLTNSGNIKRGQTGMRHNTGPKAPNRKQSLRQTRLVHGQQRKKLLEMLGGA